MSATDLKSLAVRAETVVGHRATRLVEVHQRIDVARRRRRATGVAVAVAAVVVATAIAFRPGTEQSTPTPNPTPTPSIPSPVVEEQALVRPLAYAVGQKIHYGDKVVDTGQQIAQIDITDVGVVYLTEEGELWSTDGSSQTLIERGKGTYDERLEVPTSATGSLVAWIRSEGDLPVEVVVYDVATREVVLSEPAGPSVWSDFDTSQPEALAVVLTADQVVVYYYSDTNDNGRRGQVRYISYDLGTGRRTEMSFEEVDDIEVSPPTRALTWQARAGDLDDLVRGSTDTYRVRDGMLSIDVFDDRVGVWRVADPVDPVTGNVVRVHVPAELPAGMELRLFQWLDDGVFALVGTGPRRHDNGALVVCTLSGQQCEVAVDGPANWITPGREFYE